MLTQVNSEYFLHLLPPLYLLMFPAAVDVEKDGAKSVESGKDITMWVKV